MLRSDLLQEGARANRRAVPLALVFLLFAAAFATATNAVCQPSVGERCPAWTYREDTGGTDQAHAAAPAPDGTAVYVAGFAQQGEGMWERDAVVRALDSDDGRVLWRASVPTTTAGPNEFRAVAAEGAQVFAAGSSHDARGDVFHTDTLIAAFDAATGATVWTKRLDLGPSESARAIVTAGPLVVVAGWSALDEESGTKLWVHAFASETGALLWSHEPAGTAGFWADASALAFDAASNTVYAAGTSDSGSSGGDALTVAFDAADGRLLWSRAYDGIRSGDDSARALAIDDGVLVVGGDTHATDGWGDGLVLAYDAASGAPLWSHVYVGAGLHYDGINDLSIRSGTVYAAGSTRPHVQVFIPHVLYLSGDIRPLALALDLRTGARTWSFSPDREGEGLSIASSGETVYLSGRERGDSTDVMVVALDAATGLERWHAPLSSAAGVYDTAVDSVLLPNERGLVVVGMAGGGEMGTFDAAAVADASALTDDLVAYAFRE